MLILSNIKEVSEFISRPSIAFLAYIFLWASILCLAQRYVAMVVGCGASSAKETREMEGKFKDMDVNEFIAQMKQGSPYLLRSFTNSLLDATANSDFAAVGRLLLRLTLIQGVLATIEVAILLVGLNQIVNEIS